MKNEQKKRAKMGEGVGLSKPTKAAPHSAGAGRASVQSRLLGKILMMVGETNGITLEDTLELLLSPHLKDDDPEVVSLIADFQEQLNYFQIESTDIYSLLRHPFARALYEFFRRFPLPYREEHIHLTGSLNASFVYPRLQQLLDGPYAREIEQKIKAVYGEHAWPIRDEEHVAQLLRLPEGDEFDRYLQILMLPKLILVDRKAHQDAAYHMAKTLYENYNVGRVRLKFTLSRVNSVSEAEMIPGAENVTAEDVALGLYEGFMAYKMEQPDFDFVLAPCFRKEGDYYDKSRFSSKSEHILQQIQEILEILDRYPHLKPYLCEVDTVGSEKDFYRKAHFADLQSGFRKLQYRGFFIRSHHGETWRTLRHGIQAVDNAMNIWQIDSLEHGLSLGINPNYYFHSLYQRVLKWNSRGEAIIPGTPEHFEVSDMIWGNNFDVCDKLLRGEPLQPDEVTAFTKAKFHTAREVEQYQHDVLNRMIQKKVSLVSLPSSNYKLTSCFEDFKDHPFTWWEKKGVSLAVGTDNYVTLGTDFIQEMLILLFTDPAGLKIMKLLMVSTGETRRPYLSNLLWQMCSAWIENEPES